MAHNEVNVENLSSFLAQLSCHVAVKQLSVSLGVGWVGISAGSIRSTPHTGLGSSGSQQEARGPGLIGWSPKAELWSQPRAHT